MRPQTSLIAAALAVTLIACGSTPGTRTAGDAPADPPSAAAQLGPTPKPADFTLALNVIDQTCYGGKDDIGCNIEAEVVISRQAVVPPDDQTWRVTYQLTGAESGPIIGNVEVHGRQYDPPREYLSTTSKRAKLRITATSVERIG